MSWRAAASSWARTCTPLRKNSLRFCGAKHGVAVSNGTDALHLALVASGIGPGDEVITVPNTFIATTESITRAGGTIKFVDIDIRTFNMNPDLLEKAITPKTKALLPVHLYGQLADMDPIMEIANKHGLIVVEDAAQSHGATYKGKKAGAWGKTACFSFYPGKNLGAYGDAGMVVTNDDDVADHLRLLRDHGQDRAKKYISHIEGYCFRMDTIQAAVLRVKLRHLDDWNAGRRRNAALYAEHFQGSPVVTPHVLPGSRACLPHLRGAPAQARRRHGRPAGPRASTPASTTPSRSTCSRPTPDSASRRATSRPPTRPWKR